MYREKYWLGHSPEVTEQRTVAGKVLLTIVLKYNFELDVSGRIGTG